MQLVMQSGSQLGSHNVAEHDDRPVAPALVVTDMPPRLPGSCRDEGHTQQPQQHQQARDLLGAALSC